MLPLIFLPSEARHDVIEAIYEYKLDRFCRKAAELSKQGRLWAETNQQLIRQVALTPEQILQRLQNGEELILAKRRSILFFHCYEPLWTRKRYQILHTPFGDAVGSTIEFQYQCRVCNRNFYKDNAIVAIIFITTFALIVGTLLVEKIIRGQ